MSPIAISRTDLKLNPQPLIVVWGGPLVGVLLPLMLWCASERVWSKGAYLFRFFAGFCLLSNGLYIGLGSFGGIGDCGEMLRHGSSHGQLWLFGGICAPLGLACWNGQGPKFGLGNASRHHAWLLTGLTCLLVILGSFFFPDG